MTNGFKKRMCELAGYNYADFKPTGTFYWKDKELEILIRAMWAINRADDWHIIMDNCGLWLYNPYGDFEIEFEYRNHNNSEQEALIKALEYIYKETK